MIRSTFVLCVALALLAPTLASAEAGFQFAIPDRNFPDDQDVEGMRISIFWGNNDRMEGFDLGLFSVAQTRVRTGFALVGGISRVTGESDGAVSMAFMNYHTGSDRGANLAFINMLNDTRGFNSGFVQIAEGETNFDLGGLNVSKKSKVQLGFVNFTQEITGLQLGFVNFAENGFFKFFPFFNYPKKN